MAQIVRTFKLTEAQNHVLNRVEPQLTTYLRRLITEDMASRGITFPQDHKGVGRPKTKQETSS